MRGGNKGDVTSQSQRAASICGYLDTTTDGRKTYCHRGNCYLPPSPISTTATLVSRYFVVARWRTAPQSSSQSHSFRSSLETTIHKRARESATIKFKGNHHPVPQTGAGWKRCLLTAEVEVPEGEPVPIYSHFDN